MTSKARNWVEEPTNVIIDFGKAAKSRNRQKKRKLRAKWRGQDKESLAIARRQKRKERREAKRREQRHKERASKRSATESFYESREWRALRYQVLKAYGAQCMCCGATRPDGTRIHVDHIKPRSIFPELELEFSNLQVLCEDCNIGKSNVDTTDWRKLDKQTND